MVKPEDDFVDNDAMSIAAAAVNLDSERGVQGRRLSVNLVQLHIREKFK